MTFAYISYGADWVVPDPSTAPLQALKSIVTRKTITTFGKVRRDIRNPRSGKNGFRLGIYTKIPPDQAGGILEIKSLLVLTGFRGKDHASHRIDFDIHATFVLNAIDQLPVLIV
jgi:hypothetical protein